MWSLCGKHLSIVKTMEKFSRSAWFFQSYSLSDIPHRKRKLAPLQERRMIDRFRVWGKGGDGGNGCVSFRRSRHDRRGRPDGGNGGRGGDVVLECSAAIWDFSSLQHHVNAKRGGHGASKNMIGSRGADKVVQVPVGTVIHLIEGEIPSAVERSSSTVLDPWDIPGSLDSTPHELSQKSPPIYRNGSEKTVEAKGCSESISRKSRNALTPPQGKDQNSKLSNLDGHGRRSKQPSRHLHHSYSSEPEEETSDRSQEEDGGDEWEDFDSDDVMSGQLSEEELHVTEQIQHNIAELTEPGQRLTIARGGEGGLGNVCYAKTSKRMQKNTDVDDQESDEDDALCRVGVPGSEAVLVLELKSLADVGLVGMPSAGKSTLLGALSRAKPAVGHYAFTTLRPNLGNLNYDDFSVTVADIPGLIRGAHENRGLGHAFLRHIERTKVLAYVVDLAAALDGRKGIPPWEQLKDLILELEFYREGLSDRPCLVVANKIDEAGAEDVYEELKQRVQGVPIFPVCAVLEEGVPELKTGLRMLVSGEESYKLNLEAIRLE